MSPTISSGSRIISEKKPANRIKLTSLRLNLAMVYFYIGEMYKARSIIEEAREFEAENPKVIKKETGNISCFSKDLI